MRVSKLLSLTVALALLAPPALGQGGGGGGGDVSSGAPPTEGGSTSTQPIHYSSTSLATSASETTTTSPSAATEGTSATSETTSVTTTTTVSSSDTIPPPDDSEDASPPPDASGTTAGEGPEVDPSTDEIYFPSDYTEECDHYGEDAHYLVTFNGSGDTMIRQARSDTGCSNLVNWGVDKGLDYHFPGRVVPSNTSIPAYPMMIGDNGTTDLSETNGQVAILVNGVAMFSAWATEPAVDYESTAFYLEGDTLDACGGHSTTEGWYHYHGTPGCLEEQVMMGEGLTLSDHSPFLGWSYDGFPMYGHLGPDGIEMRACDTDGADETYCLDSCSGYEGEMPDMDSFTYRYYLTCGYDDSFFPMTINCFRGCCPDGIECDEKVEACDDAAEPGYTSAYEPELGYNYTETYELDVLSGNDSEYINSSTLANCTMFYDETLSYTVEQIDISDFPNASSSGTDASDDDTSGTFGRSGSSSTLSYFAGAAVAAVGALQWVV